MTECMNSEECQGLSVCTGVLWHAGNTLSHLGTDGEGRLDAFTGKEKKPDKPCSFYSFLFQLCTFNCVCMSQETRTSGTKQHVEDATGNQLVMRFKRQTCSC